MDIGTIIFIVCAVAIFVLAIALLIFCAKKRVRYGWSFRGHEVVAEIKYNNAKLLMDGTLVDEFAAQNMRVCVLRTFVDGTEFTVRVQIGVRLVAEATAEGGSITPIFVGK